LRALTTAWTSASTWRHYITVSLRDPIVSGVGRQRSHEDDPRMRVEVWARLAGVGERCYRTTKWLYYLH
jgi:hypothetical protein